MQLAEGQQGVSLALLSRVSVGSKRSTKRSKNQSEPEGLQLVILCGALCEACVGHAISTNSSEFILILGSKILQQSCFAKHEQSQSQRLQPCPTLGRARRQPCFAPAQDALAKQSFALLALAQLQQACARRSLAQLAIAQLRLSKQVKQAQLA